MIPKPSSTGVMLLVSADELEMLQRLLDRVRVSSDSPVPLAVPVPGYLWLTRSSVYHVVGCSKISSGNQRGRQTGTRPPDGRRLCSYCARRRPLGS